VEACRSSFTEESGFRDIGGSVVQQLFWSRRSHWFPFVMEDFDAVGTQYFLVCPPDEWPDSLAGH
jgi:hypothetical protein